MTQVSEVMTRGVRTLSPQDSIASATRAMDELDIGVVPVLDAHVSATVIDEINKDFIHYDLAELTRRLFPQAGGSASA